MCCCFVFNGKGYLNEVGEVISYAAFTATTLTGCIRGLSGGPASAWSAATAVQELNLFMNGKPDVLSFEKGNDPTGGRHHFRVFDTGQVDDQGKKVWAITASLDVNTVVALDPTPKSS